MPPSGMAPKNQVYRNQPVKRAPLLCFTGIDGSGKTTQVKILVQRLRDEGWEVARVRSDGLPYVSRPLVDFAKRRLRRQAYAALPRTDATILPKELDDFTRYLDATNQMFDKSRLLRRGWTDVSLIEHAIEASLVVTPHLLRHRVVVCDRYIFKSVVNLAVLLDLSPTELPALLRHPAVRFVPQPTVYFLIDVPAEVGFSRKDDVPSLEYLRRRVPYYRALAECAGMPVIDGTQPVDVMAGQIWEITERALEEVYRPRRSLVPSSLVSPSNANGWGLLQPSEQSSDQTANV